MVALDNTFSQEDDLTPIVAGLQSVIELINTDTNPIERIYSELPKSDSLELPCVVFDYHGGAYDGWTNEVVESTHSFVVMLFLRLQTDGWDEQQARKYIFPMVRAFARNPDCGGACVEARVSKAVPAKFSFGGAPYYGVQFTLPVTAHHTY